MQRVFEVQLGKRSFQTITGGMHRDNEYVAHGVSSKTYIDHGVLAMTRQFVIQETFHFNSVCILLSLECGGLSAKGNQGSHGVDGTGRLCEPFSDSCDRFCLVAFGRSKNYPIASDGRPGKQESLAAFLSAIQGEEKLTRRFSERLRP